MLRPPIEIYCIGIHCTYSPDDIDKPHVFPKAASLFKSYLRKNNILYFVTPSSEDEDLIWIDFVGQKENLIRFLMSEFGNDGGREEAEELFNHESELIARI